VSREVAFDALRSLARGRNEKLTDAAAAIVDGRLDVASLLAP
jgi:hypothetical protein